MITKFFGEVVVFCSAARQSSLKKTTTSPGDSFVIALMKKYIVLIILILLASLGIYYRDYIPTTRTDFENWYYFATEKEAQNVSSWDSASEIPPDALQGAAAPQPVNIDQTQTPADNSGENINSNLNTNASGNLPVEQKTQQGIPDSINNYVPFTSQAPFANWDKLHDEACEEASLAMAHYYLKKKDLVMSAQAEKDIQFIASKTKGGGIDDLTVAEVNQAAKDLYGYSNWKIVDKPTTPGIEVELARGNIIIIPLAGREIGNPYYRSPGPLYHMLVISGYDNKKGVFITQDPGTKRGKNFEYQFNALLKANHDAMGGDEHNIDQGPAKILVVVK